MYSENIHSQNLLNLFLEKVATLAGNLVLKKKHNEFPSDIFVILEAAGATLNIRRKINLKRK
jgi:xanthine dehydrogenase/oxidase